MAKDSFLQLLAKDIIKRYKGNFKDITIIFPNKRAGLFLGEELAKLITQPVWMPEIVTLSEFIEKRIGLKKTDDLTLVIKLYKAYLKTSKVEETFDNFYFWGSMLLSDFDDVDKYLADARDLFSNLVALKEIEQRFAYLNPEQIEVIQRFWKSFNPEKQSKEQLEFLRLWDNLYDTYTTFKENLKEDELCFEGMGQRHFCEQITKYDYPKQILFAGFNALNACEKQIFSFFRDNDSALFYWDYDIYYVANEHHEAGHYIRENLKYYPNALGIEHFNNFLYNDKAIEYISVPSSVGQAKLIPALMEHLAEKASRHTAIVLCDERMLIPVIHSLPDDIQKINITMGYPAQNTSIAALVTMLGDLKNFRKREKKSVYYYYKPVVALLNHKLIKDTCPEEIDKITNYINHENIIYIPEKSLQFNDVSRAIFSSEEENMTDYLLHTLELLNNSFGQENPEAHAIEKEFIFTLYTRIQSLQNIFKEEDITPDDKLYMQIIKKVINNTSIPFSGEPLEGIQLMGLMETRMLDFKNLIILSANEGILPKNSTTSSFIPYSLRVGFKLPTPEHQDALFAYYFYRLLQRAQYISILHSSVTQGITNGEMSRFLFQIKYESGLKIKERSFQNSITIQDAKPIVIEKNPEIISILDAYCSDEKKPLSPSALNTYMECRLKFYFKYIAGISEMDEITEELDHRLLGNIFHECSESLYKTVPDGHITREIIENLLKNNELIHEHIRIAYQAVYNSHISQLLESGSNDLILEVIYKYIRQMLQYDLKICPFDIISMEEKYRIPVTIQIGEKRKQIFVGGTIDRVDKTESGIRIIDYKTGADKTDFKDLASIFDTENKTRNKAAFQTMLYCLMFESENVKELPLIPGIYSTKLLFNQDYNYMLKCDKEYINNFYHYELEFKEHLIRLLEDLYSPEIPFSQALNEEKCRTCPYSAICLR